MITISQIRSVLQEVILSKISLDQFDKWLTDASWNMHQDSTAEAIKLVGQLELILADYDAERISQSDAIQAFKRLSPVL